MIGIDIGASGVRVIDLRTKRDGTTQLRGYGQEALPHGAVRGGTVHDEGAVVRAIKAAMKNAKVRGRSVHLSAGSGQTVVRGIDVPDMGPKDLAGALPHLARDVIPIPVERAVLDFAPTEQALDGKVRGLLVGMPADAVTSVVLAVEKAGLSVASVDLGAFALLRGLPRTPADPTASVTIDMGGSTTTLVVERKGTVQLVRVISRGGDDITAALSERLGISHAEAEEQKRRIGLEPSMNPDVAAVCRDGLRPLLSEIRSSLDYFRAANAGTEVSLLRLVGGGSQLHGVAAALDAALGVRTEVVDPLAAMGLGDARDDRHLFAPHAAVALGLTMGDTDD